MSATILIVDDDPSIVNLLKETLHEDGYATLEGFDGQSAVLLARTKLPDLILLDVNMPMTNGLLAAKIMRETPETRQIPIILLTGEVSDRVIPKAEGLYRVLHIKKPVDLEELSSLVRQILQKYPRLS